MKKNLLDRLGVMDETGMAQSGGGHGLANKISARS
jgi:hypothetical protein